MGRDAMASPEARAYVENLHAQPGRARRDRALGAVPGVASSFTTGTALLVDGGYRCTGAEAVLVIKGLPLIHLAL